MKTTRSAKYFDNERMCFLSRDDLQREAALKACGHESRALHCPFGRRTKGSPDVANGFLSGLMSGPVNARVYHIKTQPVKKTFPEHEDDDDSDNTPAYQEVSQE